MTQRFVVAISLLILAGAAAAGEIVPAAPTTQDAVGYRYMATCSPPIEDHQVTVSGSTITIQEVPDPNVGGCRAIIVPFTVPIGSLPAGSYTLRYFNLEGELVDTIQFAVADLNIPTVGELGLLAITVMLAACGTLLLRRT